MLTVSRDPRNRANGPGAWPTLSRSADMHELKSVRTPGVAR